MANKKIIRKSNRTLNIFADGGSTWGQKSMGAIKDSFSKDNLGGTIGSIASGLSSVIGTGVANSQIADTSSIEGGIQQAQTYKVGATNNDSLMSEWGSFSPMEHVSWRDVRGGSAGQRAASTIGGIGSGAAAGASIGGPIGGIIGGAAGLVSGIAGLFSGNRKAKKKAKRYNKLIDAANEKNLVGLEDKATNIDTQNDLNMLANFSALGGPIETGSALNYGIINDYLNNKQLDTMSKFKLNSLPNSFEGLNTFGDGGNLYTSVPNSGQHGGNFTNGITIIGNGGTHEENPMQGVPMGMDEQGIPNLVEQGEVKFNDYIFSNRLIADSELLKAHNIPSTYANHSFADIAERLSKESSERPNDPISKRGLLDSMAKLQQAQEELKELDSINNTMGNTYASGGYMGIDPNYNIYDSTLLGDPINIEEMMPNDFGVINQPTNQPTNKTSSRRGLDTSFLRYAPVVGAGIASLTDAIGLTNKPDYSNSDLIGNVADNLTDIDYNPLGNYLSYNPLDRNYYLNKLNAQAGATRRAVVEQSGGNRAAAMAGLLAADYGAQGQLGNLARQAEEYNQAQRERVEAFNRQTNMFNSNMGLKAGMAKQQNNELRLKARMSQAQLRDQTEARSAAARSANLTNFFDSLGDIGREEFSRNMIESNPALYYSIDSKGNIKYKNGYENLSESEKKAVRQDANKKSKKKSKGGYLTMRGGK